ncbi:unnamed protein product [Rotaria sp. Silwood2]|nr:unnamed protein product [Rotaria sp. Silwood2]CAF3015242.1 unnamed protein product [Rotaria sp. Silwood2]CAF3315189.1 unnamed protein product [Rotaria sp. Silwood2]CAF4288434.1 unnamed protein product [Rotaria sp. Silwood2]CAF4385150.1 unnamed protein product [Rotaria sp. Silwood2]
MIDDGFELNELESFLGFGGATQSNEDQILLTFTDKNQSNEQDSLLTWTDEDPSTVPDSSLNSSDEVEDIEEDSLLGKTNDSIFIFMKSLCMKQITKFDFDLEPPRKRTDIYVRNDGQLLHGQDAADERKRSIARRKALDLQKLVEAKGQSFESKQKKPSMFSVNVLKTSAIGASTHAFASTSKGHFNALTAYAKGANASASAAAEGASISVANAHATGTNALASASAVGARVTTFDASATGANGSVSASASGARVNALNASAAGVSTHVSANADGVSVAAGNVSVTGVEAAASASTSAARFTVGNVDITGASAGASVKVNGTGVNAFNVCIGGPSAAASVSVDGALSFGNVNFGLRPCLDIGVGLNFGIPFLSGSRLGGGGGGADNSNGNVNNNGEGTNNNNDADTHNNNGGGNGANQGGLAGLQQRLLEKYPNQRYYAKPVDYPITRNTGGEPINPLLPEDGTPRTDTENPNVDNVVNRHNELVEGGNKFVGFKGCPPTSAAPSNQPSTNNNTGDAAKADPAEEKIWSGMYTSPSPDVAKGYANDDLGRPGTINRVYVPEDAAKLYYTNIGLETARGEGALRAIKEHSNGKYIFSGPQDSKNPDLFAPETVISPAVRNETLAAGNMKFEPSAHEIDRSSYQFKEYHNRELKCSEMVPDYIVGVKTADDCARNGSRERLAHVFQGRPPHVSDNGPPKKKELSEDDKLLLEECRKLGFEIPPDELDGLKTNLKSDEEYEHEEDAQNQARQTSSDAIASGSTREQKEEQEQAESENNTPELCKNHPSNVRCMKCMGGSSGPRIRNLHGHIFGFNFNK